MSVDPRQALGFDHQSSVEVTWLVDFYHVIIAVNQSTIVVESKLLGLNLA